MKIQSRTREDQISLLQDLVTILDRYIHYGQSMRSIGRGFSTSGRFGHSDSAVLRQARELIAQLKDEHDDD